MPSSASAAYPGSNGKIAYERDGQIWTINADGTGATQLTSAADPSTEPQWSPDGSKIAYTRAIGAGDRDVRVMNADGTGDALVEGDNDAASPTWSPDGSRIAFVYAEPYHPFGDPFIVIMETDVDGSDAKVLYWNPFSGEQYTPPLNAPEYSPRGAEIAMEEEAGYPNDFHQVVKMFALGPAGENRTFTQFGFAGYAPAWSPDGAKLTLVEEPWEDGLPAGNRDLYSTNRDGTGRTQLTTTSSVNEAKTEWSPLGTKLVFSLPDPLCNPNVTSCPPELWLMNPDGTNQTRLTTTPAAGELNPDWQPLVTTPSPAGYPRPKGATPLRVALVPAYEPCTAPNRTHGPPLAFPSCNPPTQSTSALTTGTPDSNGAAANMTASLRLDVVAGNPATTADEADVAMVFSVSDVRCTEDTNVCRPADANTAGGRDYTGQVVPRFTMRVTDRYNLPAPGGDSPGTAQDMPFDYHVGANWLVTCVATPDPTVGSNCSSTTTADALVGGFAVERRRSIVELGQVEVMSGGNVFLRQGLFIP